MEAMKEAAEMGIMQPGDEDKPVTRGELAEILMRILTIEKEGD